MKKSKFVFAIIGLVIILGLVTVNTSLNPKTKSIEFNFSIQELIANANAECEKPYSDEIWKVSEFCNENPAYITCSKGDNETCCIADHCGD